VRWCVVIYNLGVGIVGGAFKIRRSEGRTSVSFVCVCVCVSGCSCVVCVCVCLVKHHHHKNQYHIISICIIVRVFGCWFVCSLTSRT